MLCFGNKYKKLKFEKFFMLKINSLEFGLQPHQIHDAKVLFSKYHPFTRKGPSAALTFDWNDSGDLSTGYIHKPITLEVEKLCKLVKARYDESYPNQFNNFFGCTLTKYAPGFELGVFRDMHDCVPYPETGLVLIYSLGQRREMIIDRNGEDSVFLGNNSIVGICGATLNLEYAHSSPKLPADAKSENRFSLEIRYL
jgi:hypothetical protein